MEVERQATPYGLFSAEYLESRLIDLCVPEGGVQTGPFGSQLHKRDYVEVGTPIITVEHLGENRILHDDTPKVSNADRDRLSRYRLRPGDIVFSRVGSVDRRALVREEESGWLFSGRCLRVRPNPERIDPTFLSYFFGLEAFKEHVRSIAVGATMPSINTAILSNVPVIFPHSIYEQQAIASILVALDDKIELNRRMSETLYDIAASIFNDMFLAPTNDPSAGAEVSKSTIGDEVQVTMGQSPPGSTYNTEGRGLPFYQGRSDFGFLFPSRRVYCTAPTRYAQEGDTLLSVRAPVGDTNIAIEDCAIGRGVAALRHKSGSSVFTYFLARSLHVALDQFNGEGTVFGSISKKALLGLNCPKPTSALLHAFEEVGAPILQRIRLTVHESDSLASLRDALLPKLISGRLRVPKAEQIVSEVA